MLLPKPKGSYDHHMLSQASKNETVRKVCEIMLAAMEGMEFHIAVGGIQDNSRHPKILSKWQI